MAIQLKNFTPKTTPTLADGVYLSNAAVSGQEVISTVGELQTAIVEPEGVTTAFEPSLLPTKVTPVLADIVVLGDSTDTFSAATSTLTELQAAIVATGTSAATASAPATVLGSISTLTAKSIPVAADIFLIGDSAAAFANKKVTGTALQSLFSTGQILQGASTLTFGTNQVLTNPTVAILTLIPTVDGLSINLPPANQVNSPTTPFWIYNPTDNTVNINDAGGNFLNFLNPGETQLYTLTNFSTMAGVWALYSLFFPGAVFGDVSIATTGIATVSALGFNAIQVNAYTLSTADNAGSPQDFGIKAGSNTGTGDGAVLRLAGGNAGAGGVDGTVDINTLLNLMAEMDANGNHISNLANATTNDQAVNLGQLNALAAPIGTPQTALIQNIGFATLNSGDQTLLAANATRTIKVLDVQVTVNTAVTGANLYCAYGANVLLNYSAANLVVGPVRGCQNTTPNTGWNGTVTNTRIFLDTDGTLLTGNVDALITWVYTS